MLSYPKLVVRLALLILGGLFLLLLSASAQSTPTTNLTIFVETEHTHSPISGEWVSILTASNQRMGKGPTDQQGKVTFTIPNGDYRVRIDQGDVKVLNEGLIVPTTQVAPDGSSQATFIVPPAAITFHVQDPSGKPLQGLSVSVDGGFAQGQTNQQGNFEHRLYPGTYGVSISQGSQQLLTEKIAIPTRQGNGAEQTFTVKPSVPAVSQAPNNQPAQLSASQKQPSGQAQVGQKGSGQLHMKKK